MKICKICNVEKPYDMFYKRRTSADRYDYRCKLCANQLASKWQRENKNKHKVYVNRWKQKNEEYNRQYHQSLVLPYYIVYQLPNANNYVGQTNNPYNRMCRHKQDGNDTSGWIELHRFDTRKEALNKEAEYHAMGYPGKYTIIKKRKIA
jgi:hypothetical protein